MHLQLNHLLDAHYFTNINSYKYDTLFDIIVLISLYSTFLQMMKKISYSNLFQQQVFFQFDLVSTLGLDHPSVVAVSTLGSAF